MKERKKKLEKLLASKLFPNCKLTEVKKFLDKAKKAIHFFLFHF